MLKQTLACLAFTGLLLNGGPALGQAPAAVPAPAAKTQGLPESLPPRPLNMPKPVTYKLPNGLTVVLLEDHRVPFVTFQLGLRAGDSYDPKGLQGLASVTADMLTEGTTKRTSQQIATDVDFIGGGLKAGADADFTVISGSGLSQYTDQFFDLASDVVLHPAFPEAELKLQKENLEHELSMKHTEPDFLADERFHKVVFGDNPYSVVAPTKDSVEHITRDDVQKFHAEHYLPNLATLVVVGDFKTDHLRQLIEKKFGEWKAGKVTEASYATPPAQKGRKIYLVDRPGSVQSSVKIGNIGIKKNDPDYFAAIVANQILGGSANSRLFMNIREQKGYTYGAYSSFAARRHRGEFTAGGAVRTAVTAPSLQEFLYELDRLRNLSVSPTELANAKNYLVGSFQLGFESQSGIAQRLLEQQMYDLPDDYLQTYCDKVMAVTPADVRHVARNHIDLNNIVITVVGDAKKIEPELRYFAPVEVFDTNGKLVREDGDTAQPAS